MPRLRDSLAMAQSPARWNHNTHYHPVILDAIPPGCQRVLDVGCGEGALTRELRQLVPEVRGIDSDHASIATARAHPDASDIQYIEGDALAYEFEPSSFDLITAVASLHQTDAEPALARLGSLLRTGGVLAVIGLARSSLSDWLLDVAAIVPNRLRRLRVEYWQHPSPLVWPRRPRAMRQCGGSRRMSSRAPGSNAGSTGATRSSGSSFDGAPSTRCDCDLHFAPKMTVGGGSDLLDLLRLTFRRSYCRACRLSRKPTAIRHRFPWQRPGQPKRLTRGQRRPTAQHPSDACDRLRDRFVVDFGQDLRSGSLP